MPVEKDPVKTKKTVRLPKNKMQAPLVERIFKWIIDYRLPLAGLMFLAAIILGYFGVLDYLNAIHEPDSIWNIVYYVIRLIDPAAPSLQGPVGIPLQIARFLATIAGLYIAIEALLSIFRNQVELLRVRRMRDHVIICGLGQKGLLLADAYRRQGDRVTVLDRDKANPMIGHCLDTGAVTLVGDASDPELLHKVNIYKARQLIAVCGSDSVNAEIALNARHILSEGNGKILSCLVHITNQQLWSTLRERELALGSVNSFRMSFFNIYATGARVMLNDYAPVAAGKSNTGAAPHILIIGLGRLGSSLILNAATKWYKENRTAKNKLRIIAIDKAAKARIESLISKYPRLGDICELQVFDVDVEFAVFEKADFLGNEEDRQNIIGVYICLSDESLALSAALLIKRRLKQMDIPIVVRMKSSGGLSTLLQKNDTSQTEIGNIYPFPLLERICRPELVWGGSAIEMLARSIHEEYVRNALNRGESSLGNPSISSWNDLPDTLKESNRSQAENIIIKLKRFGYEYDMTDDWNGEAIKFTPEEIEEMAKMEHKRFVDERLRENWKLGPVKDVEKKISPTLIPWEELSEVEKDKDRDLVRAIPDFMSGAGYIVRRSSYI